MVVDESNLSLYKSVSKEMKTGLRVSAHLITVSGVCIQNEDNKCYIPSVLPFMLCYFRNFKCNSSLTEVLFSEVQNGYS